jgi:hypothetical protein
MAARFASNLLVLLAGAFLACVSFAFGADVVGWLALATGALVVATVLGAFATRERGVAQRSFDACVLVIAAWTIVSSRTFSGSTESWLAFASAATMVLFAFTGLVVHEVLLELALNRRRAAQPNARVLDALERPSLGAVG